MTDPSTASGQGTLDILRRSHQALADYEAARESRQGPRSLSGRTAVLKVVEAHRDTWLRAGGAMEDFVLAPLLADVPVVSEPAPAERPRRKER